MTDEQDDVLRDLRAELGSVAPSPGFALRVRARAAEAKRRDTTVSIRQLALISAAAGIVAVTSASPWIASKEHQALPITALPALQVRHEPISPEAVSAVPPEPPARADSRRPVARTPRRVEVLVPDDQRHALQQWLTDLRQPRQPLRALVARVSEEASGTADGSTVVPIEVVPIKVEPIAPAPGGGGGPGQPPAANRPVRDLSRTTRSLK